MTSVEALVTGRIMRLDRRERQALFRRITEAEAAVELFHRHRADGRSVPHPIALTPFVVSRRLLPTLEGLADCVHRFQALAPALYRNGGDGFRALCPLPDATASWVAGEADGPVPWALMIRPDVGLGADGRSPPVLFETNATALAGLYNHTAGVTILRRHVFPRVLRPAEQRRLVTPPDLLALTVRWVLGAARRLCRRRALGVAFLEEAVAVAGYSEVPRLMRAFAARGIRAVHGTPEALRLVRGEVYLGDVRVDLAYRELGYEELGSLPTGRERRLLAFRALRARHAVLPDAAGEFGHKGLLECLTAPAYARLYSPAERRLLAACVPWTRVLTERRTEGPEGRPVDLPEYVRHQAAGLLIKPNVGSSGEGLLLGKETPPGRWEARIDRAIRTPGAWVVQARRPATPRPMVYLRAGRAYAGPCHSSLGLFYALGDLGLHCRVSRDPVVNVARGGALACAFPGP